MRIAFIVHDYHKFGGHARYVVELATRFAREHEVHVFTSEIKGERTPGITFHYVPALRFNALVSVLTFILPATFRSLSGFDIVHAQGLSGLRQNVITAHMCLPAWYEAQSMMMGSLTLKQKIFKALVAPLEKLVFQKNWSSHAIAISRLTKQNLEQCFGRKEDVTVIYHGVDLLTFHPDNRLRWRVEIRNEVGVSNDKLLVLYVGNLQKGALPAIDAISRVDGARLVLVSSTDPEPYVRYAEKLDAGQKVRFVPASKTIERYFAAADVFLFPTLYDPFGMVITEAMAAGLPVITSASAGAAELIEHGVSGVVADPAWNVDVFVEWLERLKDDVVLRESMGVEARRKIEHFSWDDTAAETMRVYERVVHDTKVARETKGGQRA